MPNVNGVDAARQIQRLNSSLPIVIIIGYVDAEQLRNTWQGPVLKTFNSSALCDLGPNGASRRRE
jgi:hypothetical protein